MCYLKSANEGRKKKIIQTRKMASYKKGFGIGDFLFALDLTFGSPHHSHSHSDSLLHFFILQFPLPFPPFQKTLKTQGR
jgi:hypothetical protein